MRGKPQTVSQERWAAVRRLERLYYRNLDVGNYVDVVFSKPAGQMIALRPFFPFHSLVCLSEYVAPRSSFAH